VIIEWGVTKNRVEGTVRKWTFNIGDKMRKLIALILCLIGFGWYATIAVFAQGNDEYVANFNYAPPLEETPSSSDVTFTIANTFYKTSNGLHWFASPQFANFSGAMQEDLSEILKAKGFGVRGPFESYDLIPFQDKKSIDFLLLPTVELTVALKDHKEQAENMWQPAADQVQTGNAEVRGKIILEMKEITTQELMWVKTIPLKNSTFPYFIKVKFKEYERIKKSGSRGLYSYDPIFNGMAIGIEEQYPDIMGTIDSLIDPEEMEIAKKQCQELKAKKGY
jgi:hypothetical protein